MTSAAEMQAQVKQGRSVNFEPLPEDADIETISEAMVAFANTHGGIVLLGANGKHVTGVADRLQATDRIIEAALSTEPPLIIPLPRLIMLNDKPTVIVQIPAGMPHVYAYNGRYLWRDDAYNAPLHPRDLRRLMIERGEMNFEANVAEGATLEDIDWEKAQEYADKLTGMGERDAQDILLRRGCLQFRSGEVRPTNAGILLFGKEPQRHIFSSDMTAVRFASETMSDTFSRQDVGGTLPDQIRRAETFLVDHLRKEVTLRETMEREELYEYPLEAARELVVNAVAHRDYSIRGDNIRIFVFSNRMEVYSPGGLPGPMTLENLREERFSRNPIIVQVLSDMAFIEKLGYGVDRVIDLMTAQNLKPPEFEERSGGFRVTLHNAAIKPLPVNDSRTPQPTLRFDGIYDGQEINPRQEAALVYLHEGPRSRITNSDLKQLFPDVHAETLRRDLADLVEKGIFEKKGQKRGSYYVLKKRKPDAATDDA